MQRFALVATALILQEGTGFIEAAGKALWDVTCGQDDCYLAKNILSKNHNRGIPTKGHTSKNG
jgi:hypothetical protein